MVLRHGFHSVSYVEFLSTTRLLEATISIPIENISPQTFGCSQLLGLTLRRDMLGKQPLRQYAF